ncbi:hypothetical protein [Shewanella algae]|uniref:hypothetical protein n=1 Tax=Shewanella algae TaxID=38313 RepID=UPI00313D53BB
MKYHARLEYGDDSHFWWNKSKENLIDNLMLPFINGQVVSVNKSGQKRLLNMKNVTLLTVFKTTKSLKATDEKSIIQQIKDNDFSDNECTEEVLNEVQMIKSPSNMTSLLEKAFATPKDQVFVIMKFGDEVIDSAFEGAYKTVCKGFGLDCIRIDEVQDSGKISDQILSHIAESKYIISDLTGSRPNCYYETGFAHALGKELILTAHFNEEIHFDLSGYRFIRWKTESDLRKKLKQRLSALENDE